MNSSAISLPLERAVMPHIESIKWLACIAMLVEHYFRFVPGELPHWAYVLGRCVFPLFAFALGLGLANAAEGAEKRTLKRLAVATVLAYAASLLVRPAYPVVVLATLFLALWLHSAIRRREWLEIVVIMGLSLFVEFGPLGVLGAQALMVGSPAAIAIGLVAICGANQDWAALVALPAIALALSVELPRIRHAFYAIYIAQFPAFALVRFIV